MVVKVCSAVEMRLGSMLCPMAEWLDEGMLAPRRVLELGAGHGRNAVHLARGDAPLTPVGFSTTAIEWGRERAKTAGVSVNFRCCSIFDATFTEESYDLVYDSGCFHHIAPHRRRDYVVLIQRALEPGGHFGLVFLWALLATKNGSLDREAATATTPRERRRLQPARAPVARSPEAPGIAHSTPSSRRYTWLPPGIDRGLTTFINC